MRLESRYELRLMLADGSPRRYPVYAFNKSDAEAIALNAAREQLTAEQFAGARIHGVECVQRAKSVLLVAADGRGRPRRILRHIASSGEVLC